MLIFKTVNDLQDYLTKTKKSISLIPTMGALHEGHLSLVKIGNEKATISVVSIFVNPTQFNEESDLDSYPRTIEQDIQLLEEVNCDVLFLPSVKEVYPENYSFDLKLDFGNLTTVMEGAKRPGHFEGVIEVVHRLLQIIMPNYIVMGQKDYQQYSVIQSLLKQTQSKTELVMGLTQRENSGLAMSSRNLRIPKASLPYATTLNKALTDLRDYLQVYSTEEALEKVITYFDIKELELEYIEVVDGETLLAVSDINNHASVVACCAAWVADVRLIDNVLIK